MLQELAEARLIEAAKAAAARAAQIAKEAKTSIFTQMGANKCEVFSSSRRAKVSA